MISLRRFHVVFIFSFLAAVLTACGGTSRSSPPDGEMVSGSERLGWDQRAADVGELSSFGYAIYVDDIRTEARDVSCGPTAGPAGFPCTCSLPALPPGPHTLQVAAFTSDAGTQRESARSVSLRVVVR